MPFRFSRGVALAVISFAFPVIAALAPFLARGAESENSTSVETAASPAREEISLPPDKVLSLAQMLLNQGQLDDAEKIYQSLLQSSPHEDLRIEAAFQIGQILIFRGRYREAARHFINILNHNPDLPRVRLELARAYFLDGDLGNANFQFKLLKGGEFPPEVIANIDIFLDTIRRKKDWSWSFSLAPVSDSNITQASGDKEECVDTDIGTLCRPLNKKTSGIGLNLNTSFDYFRRFSSNWGLRASLGLYGLEYESRAYDDYSVFTALGPRYLWDSGEASFQPTFRKRWFAGREYNKEYGLRLDGQKIFNRFILDAGASYNKVNYDDTYLQDVLRGHYWSLRLQPRYILNDRTFVQTGLNFLREDTKDSGYSYDSWGYSLGIYRILPYGLSMYLEGSLTKANYHSSQWFVTKDNMIDEAARKDETLGLLLSLSSNILEEKYKLIPTLQYNYTKRTSNVWSREYERNYINFMLNIKI
jgi:tetratricopeptide (TPR) repeat protein